MQNNLNNLPHDCDVLIDEKIYYPSILVDFKSSEAREWVIDNIVDEGARWEKNDQLFIDKKYRDHFDFLMFDAGFQVYSL